MQDQIHIVADSLKGSENFSAVIKYFKTRYELDPVICGPLEECGEDTESKLFFLYLTDKEIKPFLQNHIRKNVDIVILPNDGCKYAIRSYGISKDIFEAVDDGFNEKLLSKMDILLCNGLVVLSSVVIGDMHGLYKLNLEKNTKIGKIKILLEHLKRIRFKSYTLTTAKEQKILTAASGITVVEQSIANERSAISDELSIHDGKLNAFILAPTSLLSYLGYLVSIFFYQRISILALPKSLGYIKTSKLVIESAKPMDYMIDDDLLSSKEIILEVVQDGLSICLGRGLEEKVKSDTNIIEEKDTVKINSLPKGEIGNILINSERLPFFKKAGEEDFKDLFVSLRNSAGFSYIYVTLMILSTLLATTGLFANSTPVVIGAMILSPLMSPIVSLSMGIIRSDRSLLEQSTKTLMTGIVITLLFSSFFTVLIPLHQITSEMQGRLNPNLLDLMVAVFSGIAGAYATAKEEVAKSLAGVAIAVALVPPLSVTGIGIGLGDLDIMYGSFLLFITNLVGIMLSASLTFIVLGYAPVTRAKKGIFFTAVLLVFITIPLVLSFAHIVETSNYLTKLKTITTTKIDSEALTLNIKSLDTKDETIFIEMEVVSNRSLTHIELEQIKSKIQKYFKKRIVLNISMKIIIN
ncbi:TIGR00341 family protein [Sulfurimonas sp. HSL-1716]|uniref:TIGR00341 family protein n=1 Tax=Hydrocurvibacter sulfurireducens TaxID=3131937 RepID=UPI0031F7DDF3